MKVYDVIIFIEHISRELEAAVLLKTELRNAGFKVCIKSVFYDYYTVLKKYECNVLIIPWSYVNRSYKLFYNIRCNNILNLHQEQIDHINENRTLPKDKAKNMYHISWGKKFTDELINSGVETDLIKQTGSIRLDFYHETFKGFSKSKEYLSNRYGLDVSKKWILIAGNFANIYFEDYYKKGSNKDEISEITVTSYYELLKWFDKFLSNNKSKYEIIYRPHPTEILGEIAQNIFDKHTNFRYITNETIRDWVINSDLVFGWRSTSMIDAIISNKPSFLLRPYNVPSKYELPILEKMKKINNYNQLSDLLISDINDMFHDENSVLEEIKNRFDYTNGDAYKKTVDFIIDISRFQKLNELNTWKLTKINYLFLALKHYIKKILPLMNKIGMFSDYKSYRKDKLSKKNIDNVYIRLQSIKTYKK